LAAVIASEANGLRHCEPKAKQSRLPRHNAGIEEVKTMKQPAVYIMASRRNGTLYAGVTSDLPRRAFEHRQGIIAGFTRRYCCKILVWYELHDTMTSAIAREKQIKGGSRGKKLALIEAINPNWRDLFDDLM
jgi:putative endonuclease